MKKIKYKILFIFVFCSLVAFLLINQKMPVITNNHVTLKKITNEEELSCFLNNIPKKDKESLELIFRYFFSDHFAYTLFGDKPISLSGYHVFNFYSKNQKKIYPLYEIAFSYYAANDPSSIKLKKSWKTWKKYENLFSKSNYIFLEEPSTLNDKTSIIFIINKKAFIKTINFYKEDFQEVLKNNSDPEMILNKCLKSKKLFNDILQNHQGLLGILLGYGKNNSWNYYQRDILYKSNDKSIETENKIKKLNQKLLFFAKEDSNTFHNAISKKLSENIFKDNDFSHLYLIPQYMDLPSFSADPNDGETKMLEQKYKETRKFIQECYKEKDFLEVTLRKFL